MTRNTKIKKYLEAHPGATIEDYWNHVHRMHISQARIVTYNNHIGSKKLKTLLYHINDISDKATRFSQYFSRYANK